MRRVLLQLMLAAGVLYSSATFAAFGLSFSWLSERAQEDAEYADRVFQGVVSYDDVVASRRWHHENNWCTFAIVTLSDDADANPPIAQRKGGWDMTFGSQDWTPTPGPPLAPKGDDQWSMCRAALHADLFERINAALLAPGGFWRMARDTVFVYSPTERLAIRMREGD